MTQAPWRHAPILGCRDVRAAAHWFRDVLGFELDGILDGVDADEGAVYAIVHREGCAVHLQIRRREPVPASRESIERDAYFFVPDADALHDELVGKGAKIAKAPVDQAYGLRDFSVRSPEGHLIDFGSPHAGG